MSTDTDVRRTVRIESVTGDDFGDVAIAPGAEVVEPTVTDTHTAEVAISLTNRGDESRTLQTDRCPPADVHVATRTDGNAMLALLLADEQSFEPATSECWRPRLQDFEVGEPCGPGETTIPASETATRTYEVWDHPKNEACMPPGEYEFGETYEIDGQEFEWRFTLAVESA